MTNALTPAQLRELPAGTIIAREVTRYLPGPKIRTTTEIEYVRLGRRNPKTRSVTILWGDGRPAHGARIPYEHASQFQLAELPR